MKTTGYSKPKSKELLFEVGGTYVPPTSIINSKFDNLSMDFSGNGKLSGQITAKNVGTVGSVKVLYHAIGNQYANGEIVAEKETNSDGTFSFDGLNENFYYDVIASNNGWNDRVLTKVLPSTLTPVVKYWKVSTATGFTLSSGNKIATMTYTPTSQTDWSARVQSDRTRSSGKAYFEIESAVPAAYGDPYFSQVGLRVQIDSPAGSQTLVDSSNLHNTITMSGSCVISSDVLFCGKNTIKFSGGWDAHTIQTSYNPAFGLRDFTIEGIARFNGYSFHGMIGNVNSSGNGISIIATNYGYFSSQIVFNYNIGEQVSLNGGGNDYYGLNTPTHFALTRKDGVFRLFINGIKTAENSSYTTRSMAAFGPLLLGKVSGNNNFNTSSMQNNEYLGEIRITDGYARYTANFTPPITDPMLGNAVSNLYGGVMDNSLTFPGSSTTFYDSTGVISSSYRDNGGSTIKVYESGTLKNATGAVSSSGTSGVLGVAVDFDSKKYWLNVNGTWADNKSPANAPAGYGSFTASQLVPFVTSTYNGAVCTLLTDTTMYKNVTTADFNAGGSLNGFTTSW